MFNLMNRKLWKKGFTLIELIVVIAILGILILIAVPRLGAFRERALATTNAANLRIMQGAGAMWLAEFGNPAATTQWTESSNTDQWGEYLEEWPSGITSFTISTTGEFSWVAPGVTGSGGGGGGPTGFTGTITQRQASATLTFSQVPVQGNLLVAIAVGRSFEDAETTPAMTGGWALSSVSRFKTTGSTSDRRYVAIFTKIAGAGEPTTVPQVTGMGTIGTNNLLELAGAGTYTQVGAGTGNNGATASNTFTINGSAAANTLAIVAGGWRDTVTAVTSPGLSFTTATANSVTISRAFTTAGVTTPVVTWTGSTYGVGAMVVFSLTNP